MLIIIGNFIEIKEEYLKKFKMQTKLYEDSKENEETVLEQQEIKNEFLGTVIGDSIFDNLIDRYSRFLQQKSDYIHEEHKKSIIKSERQNKRKIKMAKTLEKTGKFFLSQTLLELSMKKYSEVMKNRELLEQKLNADWQELDYYIQGTSKIMESALDEIVDETVIAERMNTAEKYKRRTNEELENALGEKILGEAVQDMHGIRNVFQRLLGRSSKKDEKEER